MFDYSPSPAHLHSRLLTIVGAGKIIELKLQAAINKEQEQPGSLAYFLAWSAVELQVATVAKVNALSLLDLHGTRVANGSEQPLTPEQWYDIIRKEAVRRISRATNLASRSTSPASNMNEDAEHQFWLSMFRATNEYVA